MLQFMLLVNVLVVKTTLTHKSVGMPGWKDTRNFVMHLYLRVRVPINAMHLIFMRNLRARIN